MTEIITEENFWKKYRPIKNHLVKSTSFDDCMFETYGEELTFVKSHSNSVIWTILDEDGETWISSGFHYVNRLGYLITEVSYIGNDAVIYLD